MTPERGTEGATQFGADAVLQQQTTGHGLVGRPSDQLAQGVVTAGPVTVPLVVARQWSGDGELVGAGAGGQTR